MFFFTQSFELTTPFTYLLSVYYQVLAYRTSVSGPFTQAAYRTTRATHIRMYVRVSIGWVQYEATVD